MISCKRNNKTHNPSFLKRTSIAMQHPTALDHAIGDMVFLPRKNHTHRSHLEAIHVVAKSGELLLKTLTAADLHAHVVSLRTSLGDITVDSLPVREDHLGESLTGGVLTKELSETEGLKNREVSLDLREGSTGAVNLGLDLTTTSVEGGVDTRHSDIGDSDITEVHRLHESGVRDDLSGVDGTLHGLERSKKKGSE